MMKKDAVSITAMAGAILVGIYQTCLSRLFDSLIPPELSALGSIAVSLSHVILAFLVLLSIVVWICLRGQHGSEADPSTQAAKEVAHARQIQADTSAMEARKIELLVDERDALQSLVENLSEAYVDACQKLDILKHVDRRTRRTVRQVRRDVMRESRRIQSEMRREYGRSAREREDFRAHFRAGYAGQEFTGRGKQRRAYLAGQQAAQTTRLLTALKDLADLPRAVLKADMENPDRPPAKSINDGLSKILNDVDDLILVQPGPDVSGSRHET